ncbi:protein of unknown function DUF442 [Chthoniobacter flavus Ellin428]|uniref:Beta-lactamase hydrolase-like protein phosphatase-like domain-containing protein n=1 Tax=Chthoniobacter flavus Ellin428 TaxID=497964 RepID=B4CUF4_9BACT|nr:sulfur transferase domain-containing protein [Chthoniobacter flavus]EDY22192.1 protein of unknown function DUF442 [Chthoniobacter flavus Ellin428]TCO94779.1 uncharacterized protein (TIGR01244 family) [Chthoniobacter flavus]
MFFLHVKKRWLFIGSLLLTMTVMLTALYLARDGGPYGRVPKLTRLGQEDVYFTSQLRPKQIAGLPRYHIKTVVDIRPDGEAPHQPSSSEMVEVAFAYDIIFRYIPVPHESIPPEAVEALDKALTPKAMPACLYCRTGRRAVRLYALVQASRANGPDAAAILEMVRDAGFSADDLKEEIAQRIARRNTHADAALP